MALQDVQSAIRQSLSEFRDKFIRSPSGQPFPRMVDFNDPEQKRAFVQDIIQGMVGATSAPTSTAGQALRAKRLFSRLNKDVNEVVNPIRSTEELFNLADEIGIPTTKGLGGKLPKTAQEIAEDIVRARQVGKTPIQDIDIRKINLNR